MYYKKTLNMGNYVLIMVPMLIIASVTTALWGKFFSFSGIIAVFSPIFEYIVFNLQKQLFPYLWLAVNDERISFGYGGFRRGNERYHTYVKIRKALIFSQVLITR